jgi:hypothetical protein
MEVSQTPSRRTRGVENASPFVNQTSRIVVGVIRCMVSIPKPAYWDEIVAFAKMPEGTGNAEKRIAARPSLEHSRTTLDDLLEKLRLGSCRTNAGYFQALGLRNA